jgi:GNAT superfamily N-acetyltransferase
MTQIEVRRLERIDERHIQQLSDVLIDCVEGGDSIGFMLPMTRVKAEAYWHGAAESATRGERVIIVAEDADGVILGTVTVVWAGPENQPHRADVAKMQVHRRARRRGIGGMLLAEAERVAVEANRTVLVLDTASADAERLYVRQGWQLCGVIPNFALLPDGALCNTTVFYKLLR